MALCGYRGSGCTEIAKILASRTKLKSIDIAVNTSALLSSIDNIESKVAEKGLDPVVHDRLDELLEMDDIIIEGRSAFMLLDREDVTKVFLNTPLKSRIRHVASRRGISIEKAEKDVERSDKDRRNLHGNRCLDVSLFDFSIRADPEKAFEIAGIIAEIVRTRQRFD